MAHALQREPEGGPRELEFRDCRLLIDTDGCLYWPDERILIVSDLHLEKGSSFAARRRILLPPYDSRETLARLSRCIERWQPRTVISLGDSFHDGQAARRLPETDGKVLRELMSSRDWIWICGNHDPLPPGNLGGSSSEEVCIGQLHFRHEPLPGPRPGEIAGHLHPRAKIRRRGKSVSRRCVASDGTRLILPAFGAFTGGLNLRDKAFQGLFDQSCLTAWMLGTNMVYPVEARQLVG